jgi:hypothetical protein
VCGEAMDRPLLHCSGCGGHVERGAEVCPECGVPVVANLRQREPDGGIRSDLQAAAIVGVSYGYVAQAKQVACEAPDLADVCPECGFPVGANLHPREPDGRIRSKMQAAAIVGVLKCARSAGFPWCKILHNGNLMVESAVGRRQPALLVSTTNTSGRRSSLPVRRLIWPRGCTGSRIPVVSG